MANRRPAPPAVVYAVYTAAGKTTNERAASRGWREGRVASGLAVGGPGVLALLARGKVAAPAS